MSLALVLAAQLVAPENEAPLDWHVPPECPSAIELRGAVVELAGRWPSREELGVAATASKDGERWSIQLTLTVGETPYVRTLHADSCVAVTKAAALVIAVSLDPIAAARTVPLDTSSPGVLPSVASEPSVPTATPRPEQGPARSRSRGVVPALGLGWGVVSGMTPGVSSGPSAEISLRFDHGTVGFVGRFVLPRDTGRSGARVQAGTAALRGCVQSAPQRLRGRLCLSAESGAVRARGIGVVGPRTRHFPWLAGVLGGGLSWRWAPRWSLAADVEAAVAAVDTRVIRESSDPSGAEAVFESARWSGRVIVGLQFEIRRRD